MDKDLYDLPPQELLDVPVVCKSLEQAVDCLQNDYAFLLQGDVFSRDFIENYIKLRKKEINQMRSLIHPYEFELYYSL